MIDTFGLEGESGDNVPAVSLCNIGGIFACRAMESVGADFTFCKLATANGSEDSVGAKCVDVAGDDFDFLHDESRAGVRCLIASDTNHIVRPVEGVYR